MMPIMRGEEEEEEEEEEEARCRRATWRAVLSEMQKILRRFAFPCPRVLCPSVFCRASVLPVLRYGLLSERGRRPTGS